MKRFVFTKLYFERFPTHYYWVMHLTPVNEPLPPFETADATCISMASHLLDLYDTMVDTLDSPTAKYEIVIQDQHRDNMTITNEGDLAIAVLTYET